MREQQGPGGAVDGADGDGSATDCFGQDPVGDTERAYLTLLFNKYRGALYRYLLSLVASREDAADLLQESYFRLLRRGSLIHVDDLARAYLFETARNLAADHRRCAASHRIAAHVSIDDLALESHDAAPDHVVATQDLLAQLAAAILKLPESSRTVFLLSRYRAMSHAEIGRFLGISTRTVERRMAEALERVGRQLGVNP